MCVFCPGQGIRDHPSLRPCFEDLLHVPPKGEVYSKEPMFRGWRAQGVVLGYALRARGWAEAGRATSDGEASRRLQCARKLVQSW